MGVSLVSSRLHLVTSVPIQILPRSRSCSSSLQNVSFTLSCYLRVLATPHTACCLRHVCLIPSQAFSCDICLIITLVIFLNNDHVDFAQQRSKCCHPKKNNRISIMNQIVQTTTYLCSSGVSTKFPTKKLCVQLVAGNIYIGNLQSIFSNFRFPMAATLLRVVHAQKWVVKPSRLFITDILFSLSLTDVASVQCFSTRK